VTAPGSADKPGAGAPELEKFLRGLAQPQRMRLGKALFEKEEMLLPEGETWEEISDGDRSHYDKCAMAVIDELLAILKGANLG
jgi:hypothetical protein